MTDTTATPRWYRLTPDRVVIALLIVECLLWLSNWLGWWHRGYAVLAFAVVGVVLLAFFVWLYLALAFRRRFQFSVWSMLILTVAVALPFRWPGVESRRFLPTDSWPRLQIKSVTRTQGLFGELQITLELAADGKTPVTVSQKQFSLRIDGVFGRATFPWTAPRVFTATPEEPCTLVMRTSKVQAGYHRFGVYINSGKEPEFDYEFLGANHIDDQVFLVK